MGMLAAVLASGQEQPAATFGTTVVVSGGLRGNIFYLKRGANRLPDFRGLKSVGTIYTSSLNVPPQNFSRGFPGVTDRFEWFAIDYTGEFWIHDAGKYRFSLLSDDGSKLWIDDRLVIDNDGEHPPVEVAGAIELAPGAHAMRVEYFQGRRFEVALVLKVAPPGKELDVFRADDYKPSAEELSESDAHGGVDIDNDFVRVKKISLRPEESLAAVPFRRAIVCLDAAKFDTGGARKHFGAGQVAWAPESSTWKNAGGTPVRLVEIELKKPGPVTPPVRARELDPVLIDPKHNKLLFENDQVRVFRSWREPGATEKFHEHAGAGRLGVFLTAAEGTVRTETGESKLDEPAGAVTWSGPVKHATTNTGSRKFEMIVIEVK